MLARAGPSGNADSLIKEVFVEGAEFASAPLLLLTVKPTLPMRNSHGKGAPMTGVTGGYRFHTLVSDCTLVSHCQLSQANADDFIVLTVVVADWRLDDPPIGLSSGDQLAVG